MALLSDSDLKQLQETFADLKTPVKLVFFTQTLNCETCDVARQVLDEVARISDKITLEEHNFLLEKEAAAGYGIDRVPAVAVLRQDGEGPAQDYGIRFFGAPHGYEFSSLLESILLVGGVEEPGLSDVSTGLLASVQEPVHIRVFVTPTWPHCPRAVSLAMRMSIASEKVTMASVGAAEFPDDVRKYRISGVPKIVVNDKVEILGAQPESVFVGEALRPFVAEQTDSKS